MTVPAHAQIAAIQAESLLRELAEARSDLHLRALVLRACAALYEASAGGIRLAERHEREIDAMRPPPSSDG